MATQVLCLHLNSCKPIHSSSNNQRRIIKATNNTPEVRKTHHSLLNLPNGASMEDLVLKNDFTRAKILSKTEKIGSEDDLVVAKLYAIKETVADRVEMHKNICEQRKNWNNLLLTSINTITLAAATMAGVAATINTNGAPMLALKIASTSLYLGATGMVIIMNKIQPSQLAEEQRNATRIFRHLQKHVQTIIDLGCPTLLEVEDMMKRVLALDKAYPLPLLGVMLDKFPSNVESAVWWPRNQRQDEGEDQDEEELLSYGNGWNEELENEMREIVGVLRKNDEADYLRLGEVALKMNKVLAICGPLLTVLGATGSAFVGFNESSNYWDSWAVMLGVVGGALASVVNTLEHGGQVGMVVELYRSNAGFFREIEEEIEFNLNQKDMNKRENGELFEMKVALQLGRSIAELRNVGAKEHDMKEFGSKLF